MRVEKTVFISYRRTNIYHARAIFQDLRANGYDAFLDYEGIDAGSFEQIILNQIKARAHFLVILTPSALERCAQPNDWLRREIETALDSKRNIVPLMFEGFDFKDVDQYLTGKLALLKGYNALRIPSDYFDEAMGRLRSRFLNTSLEVILHPTPPNEQTAVQQAIAKEEAAPKVEEDQLSAGEHFERAFQAFENQDYDAALRDYSEALRLNPQYAEAYNNRGLTYHERGEYMRAIGDYNQAIRLSPRFFLAYFNRGNTYHSKGDFDRAIADYGETLRLNPQYANAYTNRGLTYYTLDKIDQAIADFDQALRLNPQDQIAHLNRGTIHLNQGDYVRAIADYDEALRLDPQYANAYRNRGVAYVNKGDLAKANVDYQQYIDLGGQDAETVRRWIRDNEEILRGQ